MRPLFGSDASLARGDGGPGPGLRRARAFVSWPGSPREPPEGPRANRRVRAERARLSPRQEHRPFPGRRALIERVGGGPGSDRAAGVESHWVGLGPPEVTARAKPPWCTLVASCSEVLLPSLVSCLRGKRQVIRGSGGDGDNGI